MYQYRAEITKVVDGDTIDVFIDLGFDVWHKERIRLAGIDTPEKNTPLGKELKRFMKEKLTGMLVTVDVSKPDKYGRYLGEISFDDKAETLNNMLYGYKLAKLYGGASKTSLWAAEELLSTNLGGFYDEF